MKALIALSALVVLALAACNPAPAAPSTPTATPTATPQPTATPVPSPTPIVDIMVSLDTPFDIRPGQVAFVDAQGYKIEFVEVKEDSRCPANVVCVWQGRAVIVIHVTRPGEDLGLHELVLEAGREDVASVKVGGYSTKITALTPYPIAGMPTPRTEYTATLVVSKADASAGPVTVDERLVKANTDFGFDLFAELARREGDKDLFVSPLSVAMALAMTYNGASGQTRDAMAEVLGLEQLSLEEVNQANAALRQSLQGLGTGVELSIANSLWARQGVDFKEDFLERNRQHYGAEVASLDFNSPDAPGTINQWVDRNTRGKIKQIVDQIDPDTVMFLINAIYFNGKWSQSFDKAMTRDRPFHLPDGSEKQHPMMSRSGKYPYLKGEGFQAVSLPYGDGRTSMYVFLPDEASSLDEFLQGLDAESWANWMSRFKQTEGDVVIPRFKSEYEVSLNDALKALGLEVAFDPDRANFEGMRAIPPRLYIQQVKHKAVVDVNEEGTEAAGVTSVIVGITSAQQPQERFSFVADRPFFFAIRDNQTGSVLFMGTVVDPQQ